MAMRLPSTLTRTWDAGRASQRTAWIAGALVVAIAAAVAVVAVPTTDAIARTRDDVARHRIMLDVARARVTENATLARAAAPTRSPDMGATIDRVLAAQGLRYVPVATQMPENARGIVIEAAPFDALVRALESLAADGVRVTDAAITARVDPGTVRAELVLTR